MDESGRHVSDMEGPEAHWLARLTIEECMQSVAHTEASVRVRGISLLRQIMVQHCFDPRCGRTDGPCSAGRQASERL